MAPTPQDVPDYFLVARDAAGRATGYQCTICKSGWLVRWREHDRGVTHLANVSDLQERLAAQHRVEQAYTNPTPATLTAPSTSTAPASPPAFNVNLETFLPRADTRREMGLEEAQAMLDAARTESRGEFQARMEHAMARLVADAGWLQLDAEDQADVDDATLSAEIQFSDPERQSLLESEPDMAALLASITGRSSDTNWKPYPNKAFVYLHLLVSLPRLRLSDAHIKFILYIMQELGCRDIPSLYALRKLQKQLRETIGASTVLHTSEFGNVFYCNDIRETTAMELQNPQVAEHLVIYPELEPESVREVWQAARWLDFPPELLTPMIRLGAHDFYIDEPAQLSDGRYVIPRMWFTRRKQLYGRCLPCAFDPLTKVLTIDGTRETLDIHTSAFVRTFIDMRDSSELPNIEYATGLDYRPVFPNRLREEACGEPVYTIFLNVWADDVSGNVSKQYNKHINVCTSNMCLPAALLQQEYFVRFFSTSPTASSAEQLAALKEQIVATHEKPWKSYNAKTGERCRFRLVVQALPGDNPQQSDNCSHIGLQANLNCRRCFNSTQVPTELDAQLNWYLQNFSTSRPRSKEETLAAVTKQLELACHGIADHVSTAQTQSGVKDPVAQAWIERLIQKAREMKEAYQKAPGDTSIPQDEEAVAQSLWRWLESQPGEHWHPLLSWSGLDAHRDTPVELLHTILLGIAKYVWYDFHKDLTPVEQALFVTRLQSSDLTGLTLPPLRASYIMQYRNNLIGRHFKALLQLQAFHTRDLCSAERFTLIKATSSLAAALWFTEIKVMDEYLADLEILIANVLDAYTAIDPTRILVKAKLHVLPHLPEDIRRFGPAVRSATEIFECFNAIFRMSSVLSNHQAPSRDIARSLSDIDCVKHIVSGGYWLDPESQQFTRASENVRSILVNHPIVQNHLGWVPPKRHTAGTVKLPPQAKRTMYTLSEAELADLRIHYPRLADAVERTPNRSDGWIEAAELVSVAGDPCRPQAWVMCGDAPDKLVLARIQHILIAKTAQSQLPTLVVIQEYTIASELHPEFDMPFATTAGPSASVVPPSSVRFIVNVQHDCRASKCTPVGARPVYQERIATTQTVPTISHNADEKWVINMHAFHNASLLREVLPRSLTQPVPLKVNRTEWLQERARQAHEDTVQKRRNAAAKAAETRARNKAAADAQVTEGDSAGPSVRGRGRKRQRG